MDLIIQHQSSQWDQVKILKNNSFYLLLSNYLESARNPFFQIRRLSLKNNQSIDE